MARRRSQAAERAKPVAPTPSRPIPLPLSGWLLAASLFVIALGGGMLYDRVLTGGPAGPWELIGTPLAGLLLALGMLSAFWNPSESTSERESRLPALPVALALAFLAWCVLSLTRSTYLHASITCLAMFGSALAAGAIACRAARANGSAVVLASAISAAAALVSALGINEYLRELRGGNSLWRVFAGFVNPDFLAGYLVMAVPVSVALLLIARRPVPRLAAGAALLLQTVCLVLTGSRLGLVTLVVSLAAFFALVVRGRLLSPGARRIALVAGALLVAGIAVAGRPLLRRFLSSGAESYSAQFRTSTWRGTARMAAANPLLGAGIGTFETAYGPYAEVGYTQHSHNSFVQLAGETGYPGTLLLIAAFGSILWLGAAAVTRRPPADAAVVSDTDTTGHSGRLLIAGLTAAVAAAALHNLADSDLYIPANTLTLGALSGLLLALAARRSDPAPNARIVTAAKTAAVLGAVAMAAQSLTTLTGRIAANGAELDSQAALAPAGAQSVETVRAAIDAAIQGYRDAEGRDLLNPDYSMKLAGLLESTGQKQEAEAAARRAIARAATGKTYYRYGKLLARQGKMAEAAAAHEQARRIEPNNLDNLLALAETYAATGRVEEAEGVWTRITDLYRTDFAKIRAVPEMIEWQYGRAFQMLSQAEMSRGDNAGAADHLREAVAILGLFWKQRDLLIAQIRVRPEDRRRTADYYADSLSAYEKALDSLGRVDEAAAVRQQAGDFKQERLDHESKPGANAPGPN